MPFRVQQPLRDKSIWASGKQKSAIASFMSTRYCIIITVLDGDSVIVAATVLPQCHTYRLCILNGNFRFCGVFSGFCSVRLGWQMCIARRVIHCTATSFSVTNLINLLIYQQEPCTHSIQTAINFIGYNFTLHRINFTMNV